MPLFCTLFSISFLISCSQTKQLPIVTSHPEYSSTGINHILTIKGDFSQPRGIAVDPNGEIYLADTGRNAVYVLDKEGKTLDTIGRFGWKEGEFDSPIDVTLDGRLRLYISDSGNSRIQRFSLINRDFSVIIDGSKESESESKLYEPQGISVDAVGYVYIVDTWNNQVLKIDPLGRLQLKVGNSGIFNEPKDIMVDDIRNIYVSDSGNHRVCKFDFSGIMTATFGGEGNSKGQFQNPIGISNDRYGSIYVVDQGNHRIQVFKRDGTYLMEFGQQYLQNPYDIAVGSDDYVYVTDALDADIEVFKIVVNERKGL